MSLTERIESYILSNLRPDKEKKIGIEFESILYDKKGKRTPPNAKSGISSEFIIEELEKLQNKDGLKSTYTLEPGGQIEWASPPLATLHDIDKYLRRHKKRLYEIAQDNDLGIVGYSVEPRYQPDDIPLIDNEKYRLMDKMFKKTGKLGPWMMRNTTSVQINLDCSSKENTEKMAFVADCLTPLASVLFANSPFWKNKQAGKQNLRYKIWDDTDQSRCGDLLDHGIARSRNLVSKYAEYIQTVPAIFVTDHTGKLIEYNGTLGKWLLGLHRAGKLTNKEIKIALHQIFTHVRFKNVIEIRGCDKPPQGFEIAPAAFWTGLLYDTETLNSIFDLVKEWTESERMVLKKNAQTLDLELKGPQNISVGEWFDILIGHSKSGLNNRAKNLEIKNENDFLKEYIDYIGKHGLPALAAQKC